MLRCGPRDSCDAGAGAITLPIAAGAVGFLLCRSEETTEAGEVCAPVCDTGFSALPLGVRIGRCEARCSAERAASDRVVERGGALASRLEVGAAGDGVVGAGCSRFVEQPSMRVPLDGCAALLDCWAAT